MEQLTFGKVVGFVLAVAFAIAIGVSTWALMIGEYMNEVVNEQTQRTVRIVGFAGLLAAAVTWWCQRFTARRGFLVRMLFALFVFLVAFVSFGGLLRFIYGIVTYPNLADWSLSGLYFASVSNLYAFLIDIFLPPRLSIAGLAVAAAIYVALFGTREPQTVDL